jgi:hypothetical protein
MCGRVSRRWLPRGHEHSWQRKLGMVSVRCRMTADGLQPRSSALKLARADRYADDLLADIKRSIPDHHPTIGLSRHYDPQERAVIFTADRVPEIRDEWGLIVGDAIHNYRCALDHLWWALALKKLSREPTEEEARRIQFPIIDEAGKWRGHRFLKHVDSKAADEVKAFQLFNRRDELSKLAFLSNRDKHRLIQAAFYVTQTMGLVVPSHAAFTDCEPPSDYGAFFRGIQLINLHPKLGQKALRVPVTPTGTKPRPRLPALSCRIDSHRRELGNPRHAHSHQAHDARNPHGLPAVLLKGAPIPLACAVGAATLFMLTHGEKRPPGCRPAAVPFPGAESRFRVCLPSGDYPTAWGFGCAVTRTLSPAVLTTALAPAS